MALTDGLAADLAANSALAVAPPSRQRPPALQLWTPPLLDARTWARVEHGIASWIQNRSRPDTQGDCEVGVLLRLPAISDAEIAAAWVRLVAVRRDHGRAGRGLGLGLRLDGGIDTHRLLALGLGQRPPDWLHLATHASAAAQVRAAWMALQQAMTVEEDRPFGRCPPLSRAVHDEATLVAALADGVDAMTLSPVRVTASKPSVDALGWAAFARLAALAPHRVWALGGMAAGDLAQVRSCGGAGVAMLSAAWPAADGLPPDLMKQAAASP